MSYKDHPHPGVREVHRRLSAAAGYLTAACTCGHQRIRHACPPNVGDEGDGGACHDCAPGACDRFSAPPDALMGKESEA
jgi:hypothetical protein